MKNYIVPEMEIVNFSAEDIMTGSSPVTTTMAQGGTEDNGYTYNVGSVDEYGGLN